MCTDVCVCVCTGMCAATGFHLVILVVGVVAFGCSRAISLRNSNTCVVCLSMCVHAEALFVHGASL